MCNLEEFIDQLRWFYGANKSYIKNSEIILNYGGKVEEYKVEERSKENVLLEYVKEVMEDVV